MLIKRKPRFSIKQVDILDKYLRFLATLSCAVTSGVKDLKSRALHAVVQLGKKLGDHLRNDMNISIYLFDNLLDRPCYSALIFGASLK